MILEEEPKDHGVPAASGTFRWLNIELHVSTEIYGQTSQRNDLCEERGSQGQASKVRRALVSFARFAMRQGKGSIAEDSTTAPLQFLVAWLVGPQMEGTTTTTMIPEYPYHCDKLTCSKAKWDICNFHPWTGSGDCRAA